MHHPPKSPTKRKRPTKVTPLSLLIREPSTRPRVQIVTRASLRYVYTGQSTSREKEKGDAVPALKEGVGEDEKKEAAERLDHNIDLAARDDGVLHEVDQDSQGGEFLSGPEPCIWFRPRVLSLVYLSPFSRLRAHTHTHTSIDRNEPGIFEIMFAFACRGCSGELRWLSHFLDANNIDWRVAGLLRWRTKCHSWRLEVICYSGLSTLGSLRVRRMCPMDVVVRHPTPISVTGRGLPNLRKEAKIAAEKVNFELRLLQSIAPPRTSPHTHIHSSAQARPHLLDFLHPSIGYSRSRGRPCEGEQGRGANRREKQSVVAFEVDESW